MHVIQVFVFVIHFWITCLFLCVLCGWFVITLIGSGALHYCLGRFIIGSKKPKGNSNSEIRGQVGEDFLSTKNYSKLLKKKTCNSCVLLTASL